jgi:RNase P/RNase MRP subunit POP5
MKSLIPSQREDKRYLKVRGKDLKKNVPNSIHAYIGTLGMSEACLKWISFEEDSGIISINRKSLEKVKASFCISKERIEVLKVSGTLKGLKEKELKSVVTIKR